MDIKDVTRIEGHVSSFFTVNNKIYLHVNAWYQQNIMRDGKKAENTKLRHMDHEHFAITAKMFKAEDPSFERKWHRIRNGIYASFYVIRMADGEDFVSLKYK